MAGRVAFDARHPEESEAPSMPAGLRVGNLGLPLVVSKARAKT